MLMMEVETFAGHVDTPLFCPQQIKLFLKYALTAINLWL